MAKRKQSNAKDQNLKVQKSIVFGGLVFWFTLLGYFYKASSTQSEQFWLVLAGFPVPVFAVITFFRPEDSVDFRIIKRVGGAFLAFNILCLLCWGCCWLCLAAQSPSVVAPNPPTPTPAVTSVNPMPKVNGVTSQTDIATSSTGKPDAEQIAPKPVEAPPQSLVQNNAHDPSVVMLLPPGASDDLEVLADGSPVRLIKFGELEVKVFVHPNTKTHFFLKCSQYGTKELDYFPSNNSGRIEPFSS